MREIHVELKAAVGVGGVSRTCDENLSTEGRFSWLNTLHTHTYTHCVCRDEDGGLVVDQAGGHRGLTFMMSSLSSSQRTKTLEQEDRGREVDRVTASWARRRERAALLVSLAFLT